MRDLSGLAFPAPFSFRAPSSPFPSLMAALLSLFLSSSTVLAAAPTITWRDWSDEVFAEAKASKKLVLLDLEAVWCHWCHVMEEQTYSDPAVATLINKHFIALRVDQDSRPDLGTRYREYGWPATIVFNEAGTELAKRAGFVEPDEMRTLLEEAVKNPTKPQDDAESGDSTPEAAPHEVLDELTKRYYRMHDDKLGGLRIAQKYLDADSVEWGLIQTGEEQSERDAVMVKLTLNSNLKLFDPVWGGVYQYSTHYNWNRPHFEKIMSTQSKNMTMYSLAYVQFGDPAYLKAAEDIRRYIKTFLTSPDGAFYTSQDADVVKGEHSAEYFTLDDGARRAQGVPQVDTHIYARENGWMIESLVALYRASGDRAVLEEALRAARWVLEKRALPGGGFRHDEVDKAGPYLGDSLAMGRAMLALYSATGDRTWLRDTQRTAEFIAKTFIPAGSDGVVSTAVKDGQVLAAVKPIDENIRAARYFNLLSRYLGDTALREHAHGALRYLVTPKVAFDSSTEPGVLIASRELSREPLHVTVVAPKGDAKAAGLFAAALRYPRIYKRTEWLDRAEGPLPASEVNYPTLPKPAAFVCTEKRCSLPIFGRYR